GSRAGERLERKQPSLARRAAGQLCTRGILLGDGVPFAAGVAFALPAAVGRAAVLADEGRFATGHGSDMAHLVRVRDVRSAKPKRAAAWRSAHDAGPESLALVNPVVASPEMGETLVANGPHAGCAVADAYAVADQGGKIAAARGALGKIADVDRQQVHRYAACDGATPPSDDDLGCGLAPGSAGRPQEAIRVSDRDHGDTARPRGGEGCAIADGFALVDRAHLDDPALEVHHRP